MIKVLLIEDDLMVQEVNKEFINKVDGFEVIGIAGNGREGMELIRRLSPDLIIIDLYMPLMGGLETLHLLRQESIQVDVIVITAASDIDTVRQVIQHGAFDYIMKPFKFERMKQALEHYQSVQNRLSEKGRISQEELDSLLFQKAGGPDEAEQLPKGLNAVTLQKIVSHLQKTDKPLSAEEVAEGVGAARVTVRRYLDYLEKSGKVKIDIQYGVIGRPINRYKLA
ncbi:response regulator [Domibacillus sp. DTU_2020_1001157_1_SI_ALB_TIR_016]|uniref:response regulator n=1 Tax=Domibacillus sp. DTU_2020_1001157_1_SI_ALB_TIR_016 TaxID=3077789 RepID=UPI0028E253E6|nr:response regulator [Domibacillus sp. DTU_2020_1001157_1_SI_ALB_TIR_016]WNS80454.1 response regulator [Domibacillus sp. DTU_2020_1001157_1_SI_ALB_TIR_016]